MIALDLDTRFDGQPGILDHAQALRDAARDSLPHDADPEEIAAALAKLIVADLLAPKQAKTARRHFKRLWPLIDEMSVTAPASYDHIISEYAERLAEFR